METQFIPWSDLYAIGVPRIDAQHKELVRLINEFYEAVQAKQKREKVFFTLNSLVAYAEEHFRDEEALMEATHYAELTKHRREHEKLTLAIFELNVQYERGEKEIDEHVMLFLKNWLIDHILQEDRKLYSHLQKIDLPREWAPPKPP